MVTMLTMVLTLAVFMAAINLIVDQYAKGVMRTAVDEAARAGSLQGAPGGPLAACNGKASEVMASLLNGPFGRGIRIQCGLQGGQVVAVASGSLPGWLRVVPADAVRVVGTAPLEASPTPSS